MNLTDTKLSRNQLLDIFDNLHKAVAALHEAHTIALRGDQKVATQLWNEVSMPAANLILAVTGDLLEAAQAAASRYAGYPGALKDLPPDLAAQHDHYRLGTPKR